MPRPSSRVLDSQLLPLIIIDPLLKGLNSLGAEISTIAKDEKLIGGLLQMVEMCLPPGARLAMLNSPPGL